MHHRDKDCNTVLACAAVLAEKVHEYATHDVISESNQKT